jgi:dimethylglycine dehydrogenase
LGVEETRASTKSNLNWICAYLKIDPDGVEDGHSGEAVLLDDKVVGSTSSVAFGHIHGRILALAYIKQQTAKPATQFKVVIVGFRVQSGFWKKQFMILKACYRGNKHE